MPPPDLFTVIASPERLHWAGDLSRIETHSSRFLPSKSTIASDGGAVHVAPGVTTAGTGSHTSVSSGYGAGVVCAGADWPLDGDCARRQVAEPMRAIPQSDFKNRLDVIH